jgi:predicted NAD-dependent protein-ADP-ribosyltransferase YbiA (DUF1768 family)
MPQTLSDRSAARALAPQTPPASNSAAARAFRFLEIGVAMLAGWANEKACREKTPSFVCRKIKGEAHQPKGVFPRAVTFPVSRALPCAAAMEQFGADAITSFKGRYSFLSNYYKKAFSFVLDGVRYNTAEHSFQAQKSTDPLERARIASAYSPTKAKALGRAAMNTQNATKGWFGEARDVAMRDVLAAKVRVLRCARATRARRRERARCSADAARESAGRTLACSHAQNDSDSGGHAFACACCPASRARSRRASATTARSHAALHWRYVAHSASFVRFLRSLRPTRSSPPSCLRPGSASSWRATRGATPTGARSSARRRPGLAMRIAGRARIFGLRR